MNMKKIFIINLIIVILCFLFPIIFTRKFETEEVTVDIQNIVENSEDEENVETASIYDYKEYKNVKLLHSKTGEIEELPLDEYLYGVVSSEMPVSFEEEALKAQSVVARTYTIYKIVNSNKHNEADVCDEPSCCQAWISKEDRFSKWEETERESNWNKIVTAVNSTQGKIITYNNEVINAFFHANSGGTTETVINVWGGENYPYLQTVETSRRRCV